MRIIVLYFGALREIFRCEKDTLSLSEGATVGTLLEHFRATAPEQNSFWGAIAVAVNQEFARADQLLAEGDEVALLPPVSGGSGSGPYIALVQDPIDTATLVEALKRGEDGAVVVFDGIVRNHTRGRRTLHLVYEAYEEMATAQMVKLAEEARNKFAVRDVLLVHRVGKLAVGETSVLIAVASAHRAQAFDACRWLIDTLKSTVPIWKKEVFEDGAVWVAGEPFPDGIATQAGSGEAGK